MVELIGGKIEPESMDHKILMKIDNERKRNEKLKEELKEELSIEEEAKERLYMLYENRHNE